MKLMMLKNYFEERKGIEILAATDASGKVDVAIYSRPHILADGSIAVIMRDWPTRCNFQSSPNGRMHLFKSGVVSICQTPQQ
jgi:hypothetical protein